MLPLQLAGATPFGLGDYVLSRMSARPSRATCRTSKAYVLGDTAKEFSLATWPRFTTDERQILADGCLINFYKALI